MSSLLSCSSVIVGEQGYFERAIWNGTNISGTANTPPRTLHSGNSNLLVEPKFRLKTVGHFMSFPRLWNNFPDQLTNTSIHVFKKDLKTLKLCEAFDC